MTAAAAGAQGESQRNVEHLTFFGPVLGWDGVGRGSVHSGLAAMRLLMAGARLCTTRLAAGAVGRAPLGVRQGVRWPRAGNPLQCRHWASSAAPVRYEETQDGKKKAFVVSESGTEAKSLSEGASDEGIARVEGSPARRRLVHGLQRFFMPSGFPHTCTEDYWGYQKWLNLQARPSSPR